MLKHNPLGSQETPTIAAFPELSEAMTTFSSGIESIAVELQQYVSDSINSSNPDNEGDILGVGRKNSRRLSDTETLQMRLNFALGSAALSEQPDDPEAFIDRTIVELFQSKLLVPPGSPFASNIKKYLVPSALSAARELVLYEGLYSTINEVEASVGRDELGIQAQYDLMRILSHNRRYDEEHHDDELHIPNLAFHHGVAYRAFKDDTESLNEALRRKLATGQFDAFLAEEQLGACIADEAASNIKSDLLRTLHLVAHVGDMAVHDAVALLRNPELHSLWPGEAHKQLSVVRSLYAEKLSDNARYHARRLLYHGLDGSKVSPEEVEDIFEDCMHAAEKKFARKHLPRSVVVAYNVRKRKRARRSAQGAEPAALPEAPEVCEPRKLYAVDSSNAEKHEEDPAYAKLLNDYLEKHRSKQLAEELQSALTWLQNVDLSKGLPAGIKKYGYSIRDQKQWRRAYGLKPIDVPGMPIASRQGKALRIIFTLDTDNRRIGLAFIGDRGKVETWQNRQKDAGAVHN